MATDIITSILAGGSNNYATTAEQANGPTTDFVSAGVVGAITNTAGVSPATGAFAVNAQGTPAMFVDVTAGTAYVQGTPTSQGSQVFRGKMSAAYTSYAISANASGSTKYDWIYLKFDPTNGANPSSTGNNVLTLYTSRSSSNTTDNGTPPTYGLILAVVTVANGASSITNANIADKRINTAIGAQGGSLIVSQASSGNDAIVQAAGTDTNVSLSLKVKGTGSVKVPSFTTAGFLQTDASGVLSANDMSLNIKAAQSTGTATPTTGGYNLAASGSTVSFTVATACKAFVTVNVSVAAAGDSELNPQIYVDGTVHSSTAYVAATGMSGGRAVQRSFSNVVSLSAGAHTISAGVNVSGTTGYSIAAGGSNVTVMVLGKVTA